MAERETAFVSSRPHFTNDLVENDEGWWPGVCECGWNGGMFPTAEDAADALMEHAYSEGYLDAKRKQEARKT